MDTATIVTLSVGAIVLIGGYRTYASVIEKKNKVQEAFRSIDIQLQKRYDLIPNILTVAQKFMEHERGLFEEVTRLRTEAMSLSSDMNNMGKKMQLDSQIKNLMGQIMVSVENYPQLKSDQTMVTAMQVTISSLVWIISRPSPLPVALELCVRIWR